MAPRRLRRGVLATPPAARLRPLLCQGASSRRFGLAHFSVSILRFVFFVFIRKRFRRAARREAPSAMGLLDPTGGLDRPPPRALYNVGRKYLGPKNPEGPRICYCFAR